MRTRSRSRRLRELVAQRIRRDPQLVLRHQQFAWTRFWFAAGWWGVAAISVLVAGLLIWATVLFGLILVGVKELGESMGMGKWPRPSLPPLFAGWSLLVLCGTIIAAMRIRGAPVANAYKPWAVVFPVHDSNLIGPLKNGLSLLMPLVLFSLGAFLGAGVGHQWSWDTWFRLAIVVMLVWWNAWMMAEWLAKLVPSTPLVTSVTITSLVGLFVLSVACAAVPRDQIIEVNHFESYGMIWSMPPGGWLLGFSGLLEQPPWRRIGLTIAAILFGSYATLSFFKTLVYKELGLGSGTEIMALRQGWLESWKKIRPAGQYAKYAGRLDRASEAVARHRCKLFPKATAWWQRLLFLSTPSDREVACLKLLRVNFPRRGRLVEFAWGLWPVLGAVSLLQLNTFTSLAGMPRFLRVYVAILFWLSLFDMRESGSMSNQGSAGPSGFSAARSLFPFKMADLFRCLLMNRLRFVWAALPGWLVAIGLMSLTDLPQSMIWNTPLLVLGTCLVIPCYSTITLACGNLLPTWRTWLLLLIPWSTIIITTFMALIFGVFGSLLTMRLDRAWICLGMVMAVIGPVAFFAGRALGLGKFDETVVPTNPSARRTH